MRARNIKPGFFKEEALADAGPIAQLLFAGLWCMADKDGLLINSPRLIKAEIFPFYDVDINRELTVISRLGYIRTYIVNNLSIIQIVNFKKHQHPHHTEKKSELPFFSEKEYENYINNQKDISNSELTVSSPLSHGENPSDSLIPDSLIHPIKHTSSELDEPVSEQPKKSAKTKPAYNGEDCQAIFRHWQAVMGHPQSQLIDKRKKIIQERLGDGYTPIQLKLAIDGHKRSKFHMDKGFDDIEYSLRPKNIDNFIRAGGLSNDELNRLNKSGFNWWDTGF